MTTRPDDNDPQNDPQPNPQTNGLVIDVHKLDPKELRDTMAFTPGKKRLPTKNTSIPPYKLAHWKRIGFNCQYTSKMKTTGDETIYHVPIEVRKACGESVATVLFSGSKFGELHFGPYKVGDDQRFGPNFVPKVEPDVREKVLNGHITPWSHIGPANVFVRNVFTQIMKQPFHENEGEMQLDLTDDFVLNFQPQPK
jgi:hypothetical protein